MIRFCGGLIIFGACSFVLFFISELASIKRHPVGLLDRLSNLLAVVFYVPGFLVALVGSFAGFAAAVVLILSVVREEIKGSGDGAPEKKGCQDRRVQKR